MKIKKGIPICLAFLLSACNAEFDIDDAVSDLFTRNGNIEDVQQPAAEVIADLGTVNDSNEIELPISDIERFCSTRPRKRAQQTIVFNPPGQTCNWNIDENLGPLNWFFQARIEQQVALDVPVGSVLCSMKFNFPTQDFLYDDHFLFNLNRTVLASSYDFTGVLEHSVNDLLRYDWGTIRGMSWDTTRELIYCPQISDTVTSCVFPSTDMPGVIDIDLTTTHIASSMASGIPLQGHYFQMVTIGDNDLYDCEHTGMRFTVDVEYVE